MGQLLIILQREYVERVRSRSFILSTVLTPLLFTGLIAGPAITSGLRSGDRYHFSVVDESGAVGLRVVEMINALPPGPNDSRLSAEPGPAPADETREYLREQVATGELDGFLWIPPDVTTENRVDLYLGEDVPRSASSALVNAVSTATQFERLRRAGVPQPEVALLFRPIDANIESVAEQPDPGVGAEGGIALGLLVGFLLYFLILLYGAQVLHSVQEEKTNRIAEVLVSSVRPAELMLGKVLGVGATALTQVAIWFLFVRGAFEATGPFGRLGIPIDEVKAILSRVDPSVVTIVVLYLVLGFFLYATLFAALGAAAASTEDAQRFTFPIILPLFIPIFLSQAIVNAPNGTTARLLSWIPLTTALVMPMRVGAGTTRAIEVGGSLVLLVLSVVAVGWMAGKIYRVGILSAGSRASVRDLVRWIRMA